MIEWISSPEAWIALLTLTILEIILGIDNIIFIAILSDRVKTELRSRARKIGLTVAISTRILLLFSIVWIMRLTEPLFAVFGHAFSGRDLILTIGGVFLLFKATRELHHKLEGENQRENQSGHASFASVVAQIALLDIVFSLDSVILSLIHI